MKRLRNLQNDFLGYLLDDSNGNIVECIESSPQRSAQQRMDYYGTAYVLRLKEVLSTDYERLHSYLGDELFESLMQHYIERYPSHHPSLRFFGQHMVELVERLEPFKHLTEVAEIARIEQAFGRSFDAADCDSVSVDELAKLAPSAWATLTLSFHASVELLPQHNNSFQIWQALSHEEAPPATTLDNTTWLIWRADMVSRYRSLQSAEQAALAIALSTGSLTDVCAALLPHCSEQEAPVRAVGYLRQWIADQMLCELN